MQRMTLGGSSSTRTRSVSPEDGLVRPAAAAGAAAAEAAAADIADASKHLGLGSYPLHLSHDPPHPPKLDHVGRRPHMYVYQEPEPAGSRYKIVYLLITLADTWPTFFFLPPLHR